MYYFQLAPFEKKKGIWSSLQLKRKLQCWERNNYQSLKSYTLKSNYLLFLPVLDHKLILYPKIIPTLSLEQLQNVQTSQGTWTLSWAKVPKAAQDDLEQWKLPRSEVGWRERGLGWKAQVLPKSLCETRAAEKHQDSRPAVPATAP